MYVYTILTAASILPLYRQRHTKPMYSLFALVTLTYICGRDPSNACTYPLYTRFISVPYNAAHAPSLWHLCRRCVQHCAIFCSNLELHESSFALLQTREKGPRD